VCFNVFFDVSFDFTPGGLFLSSARGFEGMVGTEGSLPPCHLRPVLLPSLCRFLFERPHNIMVKSSLLDLAMHIGIEEGRSRGERASVGWDG